jgi:hypothetical protein
MGSLFRINWTLRGGTSIRDVVSGFPQRQHGCSVFPVYTFEAQDPTDLALSLPGNTGARW